MNPKHLASLMMLFVIEVSTAFADWTARRLEVHEWGVSEYDWSSGRQSSGDLPDFVYTEERPGNFAAKPQVKVKDLDADSGIRVRTKPILYFYGPDTLERRSHRNRPIPVAVEVRFRDGYAYTWWPQVNLFRTREQAGQAQPPDLDAWDRARMEKFRLKMKARLTSEQFEKAWPYYENRKFIPNQPGFSRQDFGDLSPFPDDERFQLIWDRLELSQKLPADRGMKGEGLPESHWFKIARHVDSDYVSNGIEVEKYLFYEGKTPETPAIALVPQEPFWTGAPNFLVYNVSDYPIHDVFLVYRNRSKGHLWVKYFPQVNPTLKNDPRGYPSGQQSPPELICPAIPRFEDLRAADTLSEIEFHQRSQVRLSSILRMDYPESGAVYIGRRNPAQYQAPTQEYRLFPREIAALQQIWNHEFFGDEGLTILYRESLAYLDEAAPLRIYTDMEHYVNLSRCSLVVNRKINLATISEIAKVLNDALGKWKPDAVEFDEQTRQAIMECFRKDAFGTLGLLELRRRSGSLEMPVAAVLVELKKRLNEKR